MRSAAGLVLVSCLAIGVAGSGGSSGKAAHPGPSHDAPTNTTTMTVTASPRPSPTASGAPPTGVQVQSVTFVSVTHGWLIGLGPTTGSRVEETTDGGAHWTLLTAVPPGHPTGIRFADATHGYAYASSALDITADGGRTWRQVHIPDQDRGDGTGAQAVEIADGRAWLLNAAAAYPSLYEAAVGSTSFRQVGQSPNRSGQLSVQGPEAYVLGPAGAGPVPPKLTVATTAGEGSRTVPCYSPAKRNGDATALTPLMRAGQLVIACRPDSTGQNTASVLYRTTDDGRSWSRLGATSCEVTSLTRTSKAVFGACSSEILRQPLSGGPPQVVLTGPALSDFRYIGFTNDTDGVAVDIPPGGNAGRLFVTRDAGAHWTRAATDAETGSLMG